MLPGIMDVVVATSLDVYMKYIRCYVFIYTDNWNDAINKTTIYHMEAVGKFGEL